MTEIGSSFPCHRGGLVVKSTVSCENEPEIPLAQCINHKSRYFNPNLDNDASKAAAGPGFFWSGLSSFVVMNSSSLGTPLAAMPWPTSVSLPDCLDKDPHFEDLRSV
jgi:hypothetical protein